MGIQDKIDKLEKELAELKKSLYFPQKGDNYYYHNVNGLLCSAVWADDDVDHKLRSRCNVFQTKKEAEGAVEKLKLLADIKQWRKSNDPDGFELDWAGECTKYYVYYYHLDRKWVWGSCATTQSMSVPYFSRAGKAIEFINYFGNRLNLLLEGDN